MILFCIKAIKTFTYETNSIYKKNQIQTYGKQFFFIVIFFKILKVH